MAFPRSRFIISFVKNVLFVFGIVACYFAFESARNASRSACDHRQPSVDTFVRRKLESNSDVDTEDAASSKHGTPKATQSARRGKAGTPQVKQIVNKPVMSDLPCHFHESDNHVQPVHGIDWKAFQKRLYDQKSVPFTFMKDYKNPCWLETLNRNYLAEYNQTLYFSARRAHIKELKEIFDRRLESKSPWRIRCMPYFYVAGITKSGTTDLYGTIMTHPDISAGWLKEPMYWNRHRYPDGVRAHKGAKHPHKELHSYLNYYDWAAHHINESTVNTKCGLRHTKITGDASSYLFWEDNGWMTDPRNKGLKEPKITTANVIHSINPDAKFIILLRDPTERVYSAYTMYANEPPFSHNHAEDISTPTLFDKLVRSAVLKYSNCFKEHGLRACVYNTSLSMEMHPISLRASMYSVFVQDWYNVFPKEQFLFIRSEDYYKDRVKYFEKIAKFLQLGPVPPKVLRRASNHKPLYKRSYKKMWNVTRNMLQRFFKPYNMQAEKLLGTPLWES